MNWLDTATTSPLEQVAHLKNQNREQVIPFIDGIIMSLEKTDYTRFSGTELNDVVERTKNHINYWKAVRAELSKDMAPKVEEPKVEKPKPEPIKPNFPKPDYIKSKNIK